MNIIFGDAVNNVPDNFTVLELDTFSVRGQKVKSYYLVDKVGLQEFASMEAYKKIHQDLIKFYKEKQWNFCEQAIESLMGRWSGGLDSFYSNLLQRVVEYKENPPPDNWDGTLIKD